jgi:hypothetical protein
LDILAMGFVLGRFYPGNPEAGRTSLIKVEILKFFLNNDARIIFRAHVSTSLARYHRLTVPV